MGLSAAFLALESIVTGSALASESQLNELRASARGGMEQIFYSQTDLVADKWHHYLDIYDRHLARFQGSAMRFLEIGVQNGGSLQVWRRFFGPAADLRGLDIDPQCANLPRLDASVIIGDQSDRQVLLSIAKGRSLDVVIDDGSHNWCDQIASFEALFPLLANDGVYICEDVHTSLVPEFSSQKAGPTFLDYVHGLTKLMHSAYVGGNPGIARSIYAIHVYDSIVVVDKRIRPAPLRAVVGGKP